MSQRTVSFYHKDTGEIWPTVIIGTEAVIAANTPPDYIAIDGVYDGRTQVVDVATGTIGAPLTSGGTTGSIPTVDPVDILKQITALEASQNTYLRLAVLGRGGVAELTAIDDQINALRAQLPTS